MWKLILIMTITTNTANTAFIKAEKTLGGFELTKYSTQAECEKNILIMQKAQPTYSYVCEEK